MVLLSALANGPINQDPNADPAEPGAVPPPGTPTPPAPATPAGFGTPVGSAYLGRGGNQVQAAPADYGPQFNFAAFPHFTAPTFEPPSFESATNDPGYKLRQQAGQDAIQRSAAAKGVLRTGGSLKDLSEWSQNFASNEYQNAFNRAYQTFGANYQGKHDEFAPILAEAQARLQAELQRGLAQYGRGTSVLLKGMNGGGGVPDEPLLSFEQFSGGA